MYVQNGRGKPLTIGCILAAVAVITLFVTSGRHDNATSQLRNYNAGEELNNDPVHLVYAADGSQLPGVEASIRSVKAHATGEVIFHFIGDSPLKGFPDVKFYNLSDVAIKFKLEEFTNSRQRNSRSDAINTNLANYVRFVMDSLLPDVEKVMWIDADTLVLCDVVHLLREVLSKSEQVVAAVPTNNQPQGLLRRAKSEFSYITNSFNAGVYVAHLKRWKEQHLTDEVRKLTLRNQKDHLYKFGSQPPLNLVVGGDFEHLPQSWNVGMDDLESQNATAVLENACIAHFKGGPKPWEEGGTNKDIWELLRVSPLAEDEEQKI